VPDLQTLANLAEVIGGATVVGGVAFGMLQLREFRLQRATTASIDLIQSIQGPDYSRAVGLVHKLPDGVRAKALRELGAEFEEAALMIGITFETIGLVTFRRVVPFSVVQDLVGGITLSMWRKLGVWTEEVREEQGHDTWLEWFQWLAERLREQGSARGGEPAYRAFARWRPRG
jgi:hypothetical protein